MYLLLLAFGGALTAAGIALAAFGVSIHDHTFDTSIVAPGVVATVGGLLLVGLGLALRVLQRIERALALRSTQRAEPALVPQAERAVLPHPPIQAPNPQPASVAPASPEKPPEVTAEKTPLIARLEATRVIAEAEASRSPDPAMTFPTSVDIAVAQVDKAQAAKRRNGAAAPRMASRLDVAPRLPIATERPAGPSFASVWPTTQRPARPLPTPTARLQATAELEQQSQPAAEAPEAAANGTEPEQVSVLKSGVVDGMAYTLYSDGSIEAQLPQGTLRFGSITELRNHIERSA
jgi:hypothetical protein